MTLLNFNIRKVILIVLPLTDGGEKVKMQGDYESGFFPEYDGNGKIETI
jgi:hypothetical protein